MTEIIATLHSHRDRLFGAFLKLRNQKEVLDFLTDILSDTELKRIEDRWAAYELLADGLSQTEVSQQLGLSRVTVGRADRTLRQGTGMVRTILGRLKTDPDQSR